MKSFLKKYWAIILIIVLALSISWPLFQSGYFSHHDDLQVMRIYEMRNCLLDGQIPCRWVTDMGYGNGFPLFNYYSPLPYYIGAVFSFIVGYIWAAKILFFIPLILGGLSMYFLGKELFGKMGGIATGILFLFAPFRALDLYVRGDITESFALSIVPLVFLFLLKLIKEKTIKNFCSVVISFAAFLLSHNIMVLFFSPLIILWSLYFLYMEKSKNFLAVGLSLLFGFGIAAFFIIPAYFEKSLIQTESLIRMDLNFRANFVSVDQLFLSRFWGYEQPLSYQIGWPYWWLAVAAVTFISIGFILRKFKSQQIIFPVILITLFLSSVFMTHNQSAFIWERIDILKYAQFPWRFLSITIFSASLIGGFLISIFNSQQRYLILSVILLVAVFLNWNYFKPEFFYPNLTDQEKLSGILWETQQKASLLDYLPKTALEPREPAPQNPILVSGNADIRDFSNYSNRWAFKANVSANSKIEIPVFDFPQWSVKVNGSNFPHNHQNLVGRISVDLPPGQYDVQGYFENTPIRTAANVFSILSTSILLILLLIYGKNKTLFI